MERRRAIVIAVILVAFAAAIGLAITLNRSSPAPKDAAASPPTDTVPDSGTATAGPADSVPQVIEPDELAAAHKVMRDYLITVGTYTYATDAHAWTAQARALTDGSKSMADLTRLPTGRARAECEKTKCSSTATADLKRDTVISNEPVEGAGRTVTTLASTTVTLHQDKVSDQVTEFAITATHIRGDWKISSLQLSRVGDAGLAEDR